MAEWSVDASKLQNQLGELTATIALKVQREGPRILGRDGYDGHYDSRYAELMASKGIGAQCHT